MDIQSAVIEGTNILKDKSIVSAQLDTEILMAKALDKNREYIILNHDKVIDIENLEYLSDLLKKNNFFLWRRWIGFC